ncbi:hypothetical protein GX441_03905 [bacterium]|nr:hypothetical protein [bacterium]
MNKTFILLAVVLVAAGFALNCCAPCSPEKMAERALERGLESQGGGDVDINITGKAPKDLPKELVYPGSKFLGSFSGSGAEGVGGIATMETSASVSTVSKYYEKLESKGWSNEGVLTGSSEEGDSYIITLKKGNLSAVVTVSVSDDNANKTTIGIMYGTDND